MRADTWRKTTIPIGQFRVTDYLYVFDCGRIPDY